MKKKRRSQNTENKLSYASSATSRGKRLLVNTLELATGRKKIEKHYEKILREAARSADIWTKAIETFDLKVQCDVSQLDKVPKSGPVVFIANHPFGIIDGLVFGYLVSRVRPDFKVVVNEVLARNSMLAHYLLPIDFRETKSALEINLDSRRKAVEILKNGETLAIFPAGGVATSRRLWGKAQDLSWKRFVAKAIQQSEATVVPIFFHGQNSRLFQVASNLSVSLRLGLFLHEAKNKVGRPICVKIGNPIPYDSLAHFTKRQELLDHLRKVTFDLGE